MFCFAFFCPFLQYANIMISPTEANRLVPLTKTIEQQVSIFRRQVLDILLGVDRRILLIVGPCSIHCIDDTIEYARRLLELSDTVKDTFFIVMRAYLEKPRTQHGWKGFIYDPFLDGSYDIQAGIYHSRKLLKDLCDMKIPLATEFLDPHITPYIKDFICWGSIGARTSESPIHRQLASNLPMPIGFKNRTDGNFDVAISACLSAKEAHHYLGIDLDGKVKQHYGHGNPFAHIVLRGGGSGPNFDEKSLKKAKQKLEDAGLTPSLIVDCSHDNCQKNHLLQRAVFTALIEQSSRDQCPVRGIMLESFLQESNQSLSDSLARGVSITDPCLDWQSTKELVEFGASRICTPCY